MSKALAQGQHTTEELMTLVEAPTQQEGRSLRRPITKVIVVSVALSIVVGALTGFLVYRASHDPLAQGRIADTARWQGQADAYLNAQNAKTALERGRAADSVRWQAQADAYVVGQKAMQERLERSRAADSARWQGQAEAWLTTHDDPKTATGR